MTDPAVVKYQKTVKNSEKILTIEAGGWKILIYG